MVVPKAMIKDCLQIPDAAKMGTFVELLCRMDCGKCGFYRPVAEERKARIRAGEWSVGKKCKYLYVGEEQ